MTRMIALLALIGCMAAPVGHATAPSAPMHGDAYVDVGRIEASPNMRAFFDAYDREITALQATQAVPQLRDTRSTVARQEEAVRNSARQAASSLAFQSTRVSHYAPAEERALQNIRSGASAASGAYHDALAREAASALTSYGHGLDQRVAEAISAREQEMAEKEADLEIKLARANAGRTLPLQLKLETLKAPIVDRAQLRREYDAVTGAQARAIAALHAQNEQTLAAYRARLVASANKDYARMASDLRARERANWQQRQQMTRAQMNAPSSATLAHFSDGTADRSAMAFTNAAEDISGRLATIARMDNEARGGAANEIIALVRYRAELREEIDREARAIAGDIAAQRGLRLVNHPTPGARDVTALVLEAWPATH